MVCGGERERGRMGDEVHGFRGGYTEEKEGEMEEKGHKKN